MWRGGGGGGGGGGGVEGSLFSLKWNNNHLAQVNISVSNSLSIIWFQYKIRKLFMLIFLLPGAISGKELRGISRKTTLSK